MLIKTFVISNNKSGFDLPPQTPRYKKNVVLVEERKSNCSYTQNSSGSNAGTVDASGATPLWIKRTPFLVLNRIGLGVFNRKSLMLRESLSTKSAHNN